MTNKISYIIGFRAANEERTNALFFVLKKLRAYFSDMEIMVVEQDEKPTLKIAEELNIKHVFFKNSGLYNRSRAFNIGVENTSRDIFVFGDADIFLEKEDYLTVFKATETFEAVTPTKIEITDIALTGNANPEFEIVKKRRMITLGSGFTFAGGIVVLTRLGFEKIGGWDERFEGWGGEDNAMSHIIFNKLTSKTFRFPTYHIDHPRTVVDGNGQKKYQENKDLSDETKALAGVALERNLPPPPPKGGALPDAMTRRQRSPFRGRRGQKKRNFILAITTYNNFSALKTCVDSFLKTKNPNINWQIIIADDNSPDETQNYLEELQKKHGAIILQNNQVGINRQGNSILKTLSESDFDLCFKCNDHIVFKQKGWDDLYWKTIQRTGYDHLIFYAKNQQTPVNTTTPIQYGNLISHGSADNLQSEFYTITPEVIRAVGYFDEQQFGRRAIAQLDFSCRCCRAGFNVLANPFDVVGSNDFIELSKMGDFSKEVSEEEALLFSKKSEAFFSKQLVRMSRIYIPYNENFYTLDSETKVVLKEKPKYKKANTALNFKKGIGGLFTFLVKRFYNLGIDLRLYFIPRVIKWIGKIFYNIGVGLKNIDD